MELKINREVAFPNAKITATMSHAGRRVDWNISVIEKVSYNDEFDLFDEINGYWARLPKATQDKIFDCYMRIKDAFGEISDVDGLTEALMTLVEELYSYQSLEDMRRYLDFYTQVRVPPGIPEHYQESIEQAVTRDRTYTKEDYRWLQALTLALRGMIPIWSEYITATGQETGTTYKEYAAAKLLLRTNLMNNLKPVSHDVLHPTEKLRIFVESSLPADKPKTAAIFDGLSSEDFPFWIFGLVIVRRLSVGDIRGIDPNASLVTFIYRYIGQKVKSHDSNFIGMVKEKTIEGQAQEGENNLSKLEGYKIKQEIPAGDIAILRYFVRDSYGVAARIVPDIVGHLDLVAQSLETVQALRNEQLWKPQVLLVQWILRPVLPPRGLMHLEKISVLEALAVAQALLWFRGHKELAALVSAIAIPNEHRMSLMGGGPRQRIPKEMVEELHQLYPFAQRPASSKHKAGKPAHSAAQINIESMDQMFSEHDWKLTIPDEWVMQLPGSNGNKNSRRYPVPHDMRSKLATLVISLAKRSF